MFRRNLLQPLLGGNRGRAFGDGDINRSGGPFSKREHAQEEHYFRQKEREELAEYIKKLQEQLDRQKEDKKGPKRDDK